MTAPLQAEYFPVDPIVFAQCWFLPLGSRETVAAKRWAPGMALPYRFFTLLKSPPDRPVVRVHTLAGSYSEAAREARETDMRAQVLVDYPRWDNVLPDGRIAHCHFLKITEAAHEEPYVGAESVVTRFVTELRFGLPFVAV